MFPPWQTQEATERTTVSPYRLVSLKEQTLLKTEPQILWRQLLWYDEEWHLGVNVFSHQLFLHPDWMDVPSCFPYFTEEDGKFESTEMSETFFKVFRVATKMCKKSTSSCCWSSWSSCCQHQLDEQVSTADNDQRKRRWLRNDRA